MLIVLHMRSQLSMEKWQLFKYSQIYSFANLNIMNVTQIFTAASAIVKSKVLFLSSLSLSLCWWLLVSCVVVDTMFLCHCSWLLDDPVHCLLVFWAKWIKIQVLVSLVVSLSLGDALQPLLRDGMLNEIKDSTHLWSEIGQELLILHNQRQSIGLREPCLQHQSPGHTHILHKPIPLGVTYKLRFWEFPEDWVIKVA